MSVGMEVAADLPALGTMLVIAVLALVLGLGALWLSRRHSRREASRDRHRDPARDRHPDPTRDRHPDPTRDRPDGPPPV